jgi:hypothetical protein
LTLTRPGSTARANRPNRVTKPTLPCSTGLYGFGQTIQQGTAPQVPMIDPKLLIIPPYQPCEGSSSVSGWIMRLYDGCRSSRFGGWTLMSGASGSRWLPLRSPNGALEVEPSDILAVFVEGANKLVIEDARMVGGGVVFVYIELQEG